MQIDLIGCSSAGKTTLAKAIVEKCRERGIEAWLSEDFVARQLRLSWVGQSFVRRRLLEVASLAACLRAWRQYRSYHALAFRAIREAPGSWLYKAGLVRLTLRKTGIHYLIRRRIRADQIVVSDNEAVLQSAHHLFVHPDGTNSAELIPTFCEVAPRPEVVVYVRVPEHLLVERTLRRGHRRLGYRSMDLVEQFVNHATRTFEELRAAEVNDRTRVVKVPDSVHSAEVIASDGAILKEATRIVTDGLEATASKHGQFKSPMSTELPEIVSRLFARLNDEVVYCRWRRNYALTTASPIDPGWELLVDRSGVPRSQGVFSELGFKQAVGGSSPGELGSWGYVGWDASTAELVRVRLFGTVLMGDDGAYTHRLPCEAVLFENRSSLGPVRIARAEAELVLFVLQKTLHYGSWNALGLNENGTDKTDELRWLESRSSIAEALELLPEICPPVTDTLFLRCHNALRDGGSFATRMALGRRLRRRLREFTTSDFRSHHRPSGLNSWHTGGVVVAFVGADATGKSTLVRATASWLGSSVRVQTAHLGKPSSSWRTAPINLAFLIWQSVRGRGRRWKPKERSPGGESGSSGRIGWMSLVYALRAVALAFDRRRAVMHVQKAAASGDTVICDRYPCDTLDAMDGPRLDQGARFSGFRGRLYKALAGAEHRLYRALPPPDILIKLTVSIETAKRRNRDRDKADKHLDSELEERHRQRGGSSTLPSNYAREINTDGSLEETLNLVKHAIWQGL